MSTVIALDYGTKRIGVATGDSSLFIAFPRDVIENKGGEALLNDLEQLVARFEAKTVVIGMPVNEQGYADNPLATVVAKLRQDLMDRLDGIEVLFFEEGYSSVEAEALMRDIVSRGGEVLGKDAYAAQVILQRYFDKNVV